MNKRKRKKRQKIMLDVYERTDLIATMGEAMKFSFDADKVRAFYRGAIKNFYKARHDTKN